jgi:DNA (cytosine-5)-methyltransferase 1
MRYLSVCSGIEAATVAWHGLGWQPVGFSEIEPFPSAVLAHHYPTVPNLGDMTKYKEWNIEHLDLLVGGTPCQSFSVAGLRKGLEDPRGNLALVYCGILDHFRPKWFVWENVPGVLSSAGGRDFGSFLGAVAQLGYGFAYRVLDAQWFGVAQRRRRVFVVGCLGDWRPAAAVLFERQSLRRDTAPSREKGQATAAGTPLGLGPGGELARALNACKTASGRMDVSVDTFVAHTLMPVGIPDVMSTLLSSTAGISRPGNAATEHETYIPMAQPIDFRNLRYHDGDVSGTMQAKASGGYSLNYMTGVQQHMAVRRLTPIECERLQGFPDNYTAIPWRGKTETPDGPRYKALGNSMAVPVMRWIGERIQGGRHEVHASDDETRR